jgi:putative FmdB family regulatory protein
MPTYEYRCPQGHDFEKFFSRISESTSELECPECGQIAERRISGGAALLFKGSGFYLTDYGRNAHRKVAPDKAETGGSKESSGERKAGDAGSGGERKAGDAGSGGGGKAGAKGTVGDAKDKPSGGSGGSRSGSSGSGSGSGGSISGGGGSSTGGGSTGSKKE